MATLLTQSDLELGPGHSPSHLPHTPTGVPCSTSLRRWGIWVQRKAGTNAQLNLQWFPAWAKRKALTTPLPFLHGTILPQGWVSEGQGRHKGSRLWLSLSYDVGSLSWACWVLTIAVPDLRGNDMIISRRVPFGVAGTHLD